MIGGKIRCAEVLLRQWIADLDHISATIRILNPGCDLEVVPKPGPKRDVATKWQALTPIMAVLRRARKPITAAEIARRVMVRRGMDAGSPALVKLMARRVGAVLLDHRRRSLFESSGPERGPLLWRAPR